MMALCNKNYHTFLFNAQLHASIIIVVELIEPCTYKGNTVYKGPKEE